MSLFFREELTGAARTSTERMQEPIRRPDPPPPQKPLLRLSEAAEQFMRTLTPRDLDESTLAEYRTALWYLIEFVACDAPTRELPADTLGKYMDWLRSTPIAPRMSKTRPKSFSAAAVSTFLTWPPRRKQTNQFRAEQTVSKYLRHIASFFDFLGLPTELPKRGVGRRPNTALPPAIVPMTSATCAWWRDTLTATAMPPVAKRTTLPSASERRRVVLTQALVLLTGMRIDELLSARAADLEGRWLLLRKTKTRKPRILYISGQALGIINALAGDRQRMLFAAEDGGSSKHLTGWRHRLSAWHSLVRDCQSPEKYRPKEKRHQKLRRRLSTWICRQRIKGAHFPAQVVESAQLGHGKGVVFDFYLDVLRDIPRYLERYRLPDVGVDGFTWPDPIVVKLLRPDRLYEEFRAIVARG